MKRLPEIGERVSYRSEADWREPREATGTVRRIYPGTACDGDEGDDPDLDAPIRDVRVGEPGWEERWSASVEVDERPDWWPYGESMKFAPAISEIEPLA